MQSYTELTEDEVSKSLPPLISINLREKLTAEQIYIDGINRANLKKKISKAHKENEQHILKKRPRPPCNLELVWRPSVLDLEIDDVEIVQRLRIWNPSARSIYLHCCGFWDETCRLGAYWRCYPRTRLQLPPGLPIDVYVRATPRDVSHVSCATIGLQLAAAYHRDLVVSYFAVPIHVKFLNYSPTPRFEEYE